ncbi:MAG: DUF1565 domain-containing protein, partial [Deltaproteobacteria bacterium]|nr:DUF1565 domain-containing protein [Deltaproteobacteria bacterium]
MEGFVDVDRILVNGCECARWMGDGPPPALGGDVDCDGIPDDATEFVYVTTSGNDANPGTLARPMRTIQAALLRAQAEGKDVLVARGIYEGPIDLVAGVSIFGGYRPDFRDRDLSLYPVLLEGGGPEGGMPVVRCREIRTRTVVDGVIIQGSDATLPGVGSTAVLFDGCGPEVSFVRVTILSGSGADGSNGADSSARLPEWGLRSLSELNGVNGGDGREGTAEGPCVTIPGGAGGVHFCRGRDVSGGKGGDATCPGSICRNGQPCANAGCTDFTIDGRCDIELVRSLAVSNPPAAPGRGERPGAPGEVTYNAPTNRMVCNFCDDNPSLPRNGGNG